MLELNDCLLWESRIVPDCPKNAVCKRCGWNRKVCQERMERIRNRDLATNRLGRRYLRLAKWQAEPAE